MHRFRLQLISAALVGFALVGLQPAARADTQPDPSVSATTASSTNEGDITSSGYASSVENVAPESSSDARVGGSCRQVTATQSAKNSGGTTMFWLRLKVYWCFNGDSLWGRKYWVDDYANGWFFWNTTPPRTTVYAGPPYDVTTREKMEQCPPFSWGSACVYKWPWVHIIARRTGGYAIYHGID